MVDKDRTAGGAKKASGKIKEGAGKLAGNTRLKNEGKAEKTGGKIQNKVGQVKDTVRNKVK